jgi:hypothetical protein
MKEGSMSLLARLRLSKLLRVDTVLGQAGDAVAAVLFFFFVCLSAALNKRLKAFGKGVFVGAGRAVPR